MSDTLKSIYINEATNKTKEMEVFKRVIKNKRPHLIKRKIVKGLLKKYKPLDIERIKILEKARKKAHSTQAKIKRNISNSLK